MNLFEFLMRSCLFDVRCFWMNSSLNLLILSPLQATIGPCNIQEPNSWKVVEHTKWKRFVSLIAPSLSMLFMLTKETLRSPYR